MKIYKFDGKEYNSIPKLEDILYKISLVTLITELENNKNADVCNLIKKEYLRRMNIYTNR